MHVSHSPPTPPTVRPPAQVGTGGGIHCTKAGGDSLGVGSGIRRGVGMLKVCSLECDILPKMEELVGGWALRQRGRVDEERCGRGRYTWDGDGTR